MSLPRERGGRAILPTPVDFSERGPAWAKGARPVRCIVGSPGPLPLESIDVLNEQIARSVGKCDREEK